MEDTSELLRKGMEFLTRVFLITYFTLLLRQLWICRGGIRLFGRHQRR